MMTALLRYDRTPSILYHGSVQIPVYTGSEETVQGTSYRKVQLPAKGILC